MTKPAALTLILPWPPSVNGYWRNFQGRQILSARAREYRQKAAAAIMEQGNPAMTGRVKVTERFYPPTKRDYDIDNFRKAYRDAMTHAGVIQDDKMIYEDGGKKMPKDAANPRIELTIERSE